jgi:hypothetical protein
MTSISLFRLCPVNIGSFWQASLACCPPRRTKLSPSIAVPYQRLRWSRRLCVISPRCYSAIVYFPDVCRCGPWKENHLETPCFSSVASAQGSFTVLLLFKFLGGDHDRGITPLFSYTAEKNGRKLEADLTCLYKSSTRQDSATHVLHAECKSLNRFEPEDVSRMGLLAEEFPGSGLIFGTLNDSLDPSEIEIIKPFVQAEWDKRLQGQPYNAVIILTGVELFSLRGLSDCWRGKGGLYEKFDKRSFEHADPESMADATQQLYFGLPSWYEWSELQAAKKKKKKRVAKHK